MMKYPSLSLSFGKTMRDLTQILQASDKALENMWVAFLHMAYYMNSAEYIIAIVESNQYKAVDSVQTFFQLIIHHELQVYTFPRLTTTAQLKR